MKHQSAKWAVGLVIVFMGLSLILRTAGIEFSPFFTGWWTIPIIVVAIVSMSGSGVSPWNFGLLVLGSWLLANQRGWIPDWFNSAYVVGATIIGFGLLFIFNPRQQTTDREQEVRSRPRAEQRFSATETRKSDGSSNPSYTAIFAGQDIRNVTENLDGCTMFALFGGLSVDFSDAVIDHDILIDASAVFGGIDIRFPANVRVETRATPLFGGVDNRASKRAKTIAPTVTVRCLAAFGGVDIS